MGAIKGVVFDWDGTLVDTMPVKLENAGELFAERLGADNSAVVASYRRHSGIPRRELFERIARETVGRGLSEDEFAGLSQRFTELNLAAYRPERVLPADTGVALDRLAANGLKLFVSSSAIPAEVETLAERLGLKSAFLEVLGSRPGFRKGAEHVRFIGERHGLRPQDLAMIGDEAADVRYAKELGLRSFAIARGKGTAELEAERPDHLIRDLRELAEILCAPEARS